MGTGSGKKKIAISKIEDIKRRRVTFTKRRQGLFKKSDQLPSLSGCSVAVLCFSSAMKPFLYGDLSLLEQAAATGAINTIGNSNSGDVASVGDNLGHGDDEEQLLTDREFAELMEHDPQELAQLLEFELDELLEYDQDPANAASCSMNTSSDLIQYNRNALQQIAPSTFAVTFQHSKSGWPSDIASVGDNLGHGDYDQQLLMDHELAEFMEHDPQELAQLLDQYDEDPAVSAACCGMNTSNDPIQYNRNALQQITTSTSAAMLPRSYDPSAASYTNNNNYVSEFMEFDDQELAQLLECYDQDPAAMNTSSDLIQYYNSNALQQIAPSTSTSAATFQHYYSYNPPSAAYISNIDINNYVSEEMLQIASSNRSTDHNDGLSYDSLKLLA
ncbi:unnamed protein product [Rhodiola kirilowii]